MINARACACDILIEVLEEKRPLHLVLSSRINSYHDIERQDKAFISKLVRGTVERCITLDYFIDSVSKTKTGAMKPFIRELLRMSVYQLAYMNVPQSAACNEAVKLAKKRGFVNLAGFVNGVLRNIARNLADITELKEIRNQKERMLVQYSVPEWLVKELSYYDYPTEKILSYYLTQSDVSCRANISKCEPQKLMRKLSDKGLKLQPSCINPKCFKLIGSGSLDEIEEFAEGDFCIQDESSVLATDLAGIKAGERVLDLCAAPGGKSMNAADILLSINKGGSVLSCDISESKTALIADNLKRCGFSNVELAVNDATVYNKDFFEAFDVVIADVPCSGLGIIGKKPDIKYNMSNEKQEELVKLQRSILTNAVQYVKKGGTLVFSTCTLNPSENEENVRFLTEEKGFCPVDISKRLPEAINEPQAQKGYLTLLPGKYGTDGFFIAVLKRKVDE